MTNERAPVRVSLKAIVLPVYAWNSAPISGINLLRSLVYVGSEFAFPIDCSAAKHLEFTKSPSTVKTYTKTQAKLMEAS